MRFLKILRELTLGVKNVNCRCLAENMIKLQRISWLSQSQQCD